MSVAALYRFAGSHVNEAPTGGRMDQVKKPCTHFGGTPRHGVGPCVVKNHLIVRDIDCLTCGSWAKAEEVPEASARSEARTAPTGADLTPPTVNTGRGGSDPKGAGVASA